MGESAVGSEELRKERSSFRGTLERGAVRHALICIFWCPPPPLLRPLPRPGRGRGRGGELMGGECRGRRRSGSQRQEGGTCRLLSRSRRSQPAALKLGLAKLGVALPPLPLARLLSHVRAPRGRRLQPRPSHRPHSPSPVQPLPALWLAWHWFAMAFYSQAGSDPPGGCTDQAPLVTLKIPAQAPPRVQCRSRRELDTCRVAGQSDFYSPLSA